MCAGCWILALPTLSWWPVACVAFVPLLLVVRPAALPAEASRRRRRPWRRRLLIGWLAGLVAYLVLFRWLGFTLSVMTNFPSWVHVLAVVAYAAWHGLMFGVWMAVAEPCRRELERRAPGAGPLALAATFVAVEWLWPMLFPWSLGHALWQVPPVAGLMAVTGVAGPAFLVVAINGWVADAAFGRLAPATRATPRTTRLVPITVASLLAVGSVWWALAATAEPERVLRLGVMQPNYTLAEKKRANLRMREALFQRFLAALHEVEPREFDLLVASEGGFPLYWDLNATPDMELTTERASTTGATVRLLRTVRDHLKTHVIVGGLRSTETGATRNAAVHIGPDGTIRGHYDKQGLVPFSEYLPMRELLTDLFGPIKGIGSLEPGDQPCRFDVDGTIVACGICYEGLLAGQTRADMGDADVLVNLTIDTWFGRTTAPRFHVMAQASRAVEHGVPLVRAALTGISTVIDTNGQTGEQLPMEVAGLIRTELPIGGPWTPYRAVGPVFAYLCVFALLWLCIAIRKKTREPFLGGDVTTKEDPERRRGSDRN